MDQTIANVYVYESVSPDTTLNRAMHIDNIYAFVLLVELIEYSNLYV